MHSRITHVTAAIVPSPSGINRNGSSLKKARAIVMDGEGTSEQRVRTRDRGATDKL